jgi:hypothetical protein
MLNLEAEDGYVICQEVSYYRAAQKTQTCKKQVIIMTFLKIVLF